jgi:iron complex outermembrane receptor protein
MGPTPPNSLYTAYYGTTAQDKEENNVGGLLRYEHDLAGGRGTVYASLSRSMRTADATERYIASNGSVDNRWVGNPNIDPERHHQADLGILWKGDGWQADASLFYDDVADYILRDRLHGVGGLGADNSTIYRNVDATLFGGEVSLNKRIGSNWSAAIGLAYVQAENDTDDRPIAQTPPLEGILSLDYSRAAWQAGARVRAAARQSRVDTDPTTGSGLDAQKTPAWAVLDLHGSYMVNESVSIDLGIDNVFDRDYAQHLNRANSFDPTQVQVNEPGRSAWLKLTAMF